MRRKLGRIDGDRIGSVERSGVIFWFPEVFENTGSDSIE